MRAFGQSPRMHHVYVAIMGTLIFTAQAMANGMPWEQGTAKVSASTSQNYAPLVIGAAIALGAATWALLPQHETIFAKLIPWGVAGSVAVGSFTYLGAWGATVASGATLY